MIAKNKKNIIVEVVTSDSSDFEVTELYVHFASDKDCKFFKEKKRFIAKETGIGELLLPPYKLEYEKTLRFYLKRFLIFPYIGYEGVRL